MRTVIDRAELTRLNAAGLSDRQIADRLGVKFDSVRNARRRCGLPTVDGRATDEYRRRAVEIGREFYHRSHEKARRVFAAQREKLAATYGLPVGLTPMQVRIVVALSGGPMTTRALADTLQVRTHAKGLSFARFTYKYGTIQGGNYLTDLRRRGLVASMRPKSRAEAVYFLTPHCMDLLSGAKHDTRGNDCGSGAAGETGGAELQAAGRH